jgi:hypothetical protein
MVRLLARVIGIGLLSAVKNHTEYGDIFLG